MPIIEICLAASLHLLAGDWNDRHPCVNVRVDQFAVGAFYNSEYSTSVYASYNWQIGESPFSVELGAATGYSSAKVVPFFRAKYEITDRATLFVAPAYNVGTEEMGAVLGIEFTLLRFGG